MLELIDEELRLTDGVLELIEELLGRVAVTRVLLWRIGADEAFGRTDGVVVRRGTTLVP